MSAADKLRALELEIDEWIENAPQRDAYTAAEQAMSLLFRYSESLPEIIAVVERVEPALDLLTSIAYGEHQEVSRMNELRLSAYEALEALERKLNQDEQDT